jgi:hypothetical protein
LGLKGNLHEDNFEDFIKNKINEFDDAPSNDMWNRIEGVIPPKPTVSIVKYLKPMAAAASVALVAVTMWWVVSDFKNENAVLSKELKEATNKIDKLSNQVEKMQPIVKQQASEGQEILEGQETLEEQKTDKPVIFNKNQAVASNTNQASSTVQNNLPPTKTGSKISNKNDKRPNYINLSTDEKIVQGIAKKEDILSENNSTEEINQVPSEPMSIVASSEDDKNDVIYTTDEVDYLKNKNITVLAFTSSPDKDRMVEPLKIEQEKKETKRVRAKGNWSAGITVRPFQNKNFIKTPPGAAKRPTERQAIGLAIGGQVSYQINKNWSVSVGLARQSESAEIMIPNRINYDKGNEIPFDTEFNICNHNYSANSPYGEFNVNVDLFRNKDKNLSDGAPLDLDLMGLYEKRSLNLPITVQYQRTIKKLKLGGRLGVSPQFTLENQFSATQVNVDEEGVLAQGVQLSQSPDFNKKVNFDGIVGFTAAYPLSKSWTLSVEPTTYISLKNKFRSPKGSSIQTASSGVQIGLSYQF